MTSPKTLLSLDPGKTTGYAWTTAYPDRLELIQTGLIPWDDRFEELQKIVNAYPWDNVIVETFRLFPHKARAQIGSEFPAVQIIGIVEYLLWERDYLDRLVYQDPSTKKRTTVLPDDTPTNPHMQDAVKHARYFSVVTLGYKC